MPWTQNNEIELNSAKARVAQLEAERSKAVDEVRDIAKRIEDRLNQGYSLAAALIEWSNELRDALAPFNTAVERYMAPAPLRPDPEQVQRAYGVAGGGWPGASAVEQYIRDPA